MADNIQDWRTFVNQNINTNAANLITGAILNSALIDLSNLVVTGVLQMGSGENVSVAGTVINFPLAFLDTNYSLTVLCYDLAGDPVGVKITNRTTSSFTATPAADALLDYKTYHL